MERLHSLIKLMHFTTDIYKMFFKSVNPEIPETYYYIISK